MSGQSQGGEQVRGHRWFAALYDRLMASAERGFLRQVRQEVVGGARGRVLEIGAGTGANFPYYHDGAEVVALEPDPYMLRRARRRLRELGKRIDLQQAPAEELPFADASFDAVVATLVLCTVRDPHRALTEIRRVLKPGGEYRFFEHVRFDHPLGAFWQDLVTPLWRWLGGGCHPNRDTARAIRESGFEILELRRTNPVPPIPPMVFARPHIQGVARPA